MLETPDQWSVYGFTFANYLANRADAQPKWRLRQLDRAMLDAFRKMRRFLMRCTASPKTRRSR